MLAMNPAVLHIFSSGREANLKNFLQPFFDSTALRANVYLFLMYFITNYLMLCFLCYLGGSLVYLRL